MTRENLLYILVLLVGLVAALHAVAIEFSLYWRLSWFDNFPHFFGGAFVALGLFWLRFFSGYYGVKRTPPFFGVFILMFFGSLIVGIGWEMFERLLGLVWSPEGYWLDTISDVGMDMLGALAAYFFVRHRL